MTLRYANVLERGRSVLRFQALAYLVGLASLFGAAPASAQFGCSTVVSLVSYVCYDDDAVGLGLHVNEVQFQITSDGNQVGVTFPYQNDAAKALIPCPVSASSSTAEIRGRWYNVAAWMPWSQKITLPCAPRSGGGGGSSSLPWIFIHFGLNSGPSCGGACHGGGF